MLKHPRLGSMLTLLESTASMSIQDLDGEDIQEDGSLLVLESRGRATTRSIAFTPSEYTCFNMRAQRAQKPQSWGYFPVLNPPIWVESFVNPTLFAFVFVFCILSKRVKRGSCLFSLKLVCWRPGDESPKGPTLDLVFATLLMA
jgi:hypothetical protein